MSQTLRKIAAVAALISIAASIVPQTFAAGDYTATAAADKLAASGFIVDNAANPAGYRLADNLLRQEAVGTAGKVLGIIPTESADGYTCAGKFSDVKANGWVCRAVELAAAAGLTNAANATFRPMANLSKFEALVFALRAGKLIPEGSTLTKSDLINLGVDNGLITSAAGFNADAPATRGEFFQFTVRGLDAANGGSELCDILGSDLCNGGTTGGTTGGSTTGGAVSAALATTNPVGYTVPKGANGLKVASYKVTASTDSVVSSVTLKRLGLSNDSDTTNFAVLVDGVRATDAKDENSDDEVMLTFKNGGIALKAGQSVTMDVLVDISSTAATSAEMAISLIKVGANGTVSGLPVTGNTFRIGSSVASEIDVLSDGSVSNPSLGKEGADLFRFKVKNTASNDTMTLRGITFKHTGGADENTDLKNFKLMKNTEVLATVASTATQYVSFVLTTPLTITSGNSVSLKVVGDVVGGAGKTIEFEVNSELDVMASSTRYGDAIDVLIDTDPTATVANIPFDDVTIKAGIITLIKVNPPASKIREDKDDVVLGSFTVSAAQAGLELKKLGVVVTTAATTADGPRSDITCVAGTDDSECYIENVQVRVKETGATYDLSTSALVGATREYYDSAFDYSLVKGSQTFEIIADTQNNITAFNTANFTLSMSADTSVNDGSNNGGFKVEETADDTIVTDITPSSLSWNKVDGSESGLTAGAINTGVQNVVIGGDVSALKFSLDSDESSANTVEDLTVTATLTDANSNTLKSKTQANQIFTQAKLYKDSVSDANLIKSKSASDFTLSSGVVTAKFDDFTTTIPANTVQNYVVVFTVVDDSVLGDTGNVDWFTTSLTVVTAKDVDNNDVSVSSLPATSSGSKVIVKGAGSLTAINDVDNSKADFSRNVLGNTTSPYVAAYKLTATNEAIRVKDLSLTFTDSGTDFTDSVNTVSLYDGSDTLIQSKTVSGSDTISFTGINFTAAEGNSYIFVKVATNKIGKNAPGVQTDAAGMTVAMSITSADGSSSGDTLAGLPIAATGSSNTFQVVPVKISALAFVNSYSGVNLATSLSGSDDVIGILAVTADNSTNTSAASGSTLKLELDDVRIKINTNSNLIDLNDVKLIKIGGSDSDGVASATTACATTDVSVTLPNSPTCVFDTNALTGEDELISAGTTSYYKITADTATLATGTATVRPELAVLDGGTSGTTASIEYSSDDSATLIYQTRLDFSTLNGSSVSISN